jgi:hypothetical protein
MAEKGVDRLVSSRLLKNVASDDRTRRAMAKKRNLLGVNENFELLSNAVMLSAVVFQQSARPFGILTLFQGRVSLRP